MRTNLLNAEKRRLNLCVLYTLQTKKTKYTRYTVQKDDFSSHCILRTVGVTKKKKLIKWQHLVVHITLFACSMRTKKAPNKQINRLEKKQNNNNWSPRIDQHWFCPAVKDSTWAPRLSGKFKSCLFVSVLPSRSIFSRSFKSWKKKKKESKISLVSGTWAGKWSVHHPKRLVLGSRSRKVWGVGVGVWGT